MPTGNSLTPHPTPHQTLFAFPSMDIKKIHEKEVQTANKIIFILCEVLKVHVTSANYPHLIASAINTSLNNVAAEIGAIGSRRKSA